nr:MAG TPA: hypothetical protein [Caudoviricetes sp.]
MLIDCYLTLKPLHSSHAGAFIFQYSSMITHSFYPFPVRGQMAIIDCVIR